MAANTGLLEFVFPAFIEFTAAATQTSTCNTSAFIADPLLTPIYIFTSLASFTLTFANTFYDESMIFLLQYLFIRHIVNTNYKFQQLAKINRIVGCFLVRDCHSHKKIISKPPQSAAAVHLDLDLNQDTRALFLETRLKYVPATRICGV